MSLRSFSTLFICLLALGCEEEVKRKYPTIKTGVPTQINSQGANFSATIEQVPGQFVKDHGFIWSTNSYELTMSLGATVDREVSFAARSGLVEGNAEVKAYLKTDLYTVYGEAISFSSEGSEGPMVFSFSPHTAKPLDTVEVQGINFVTNPLVIGTATYPYASIGFGVPASGNMAKFVIPYYIHGQTTFRVSVGSQHTPFPQPLTITLPYWRQLTDFPGPPRENCVSFAINGKGYVGTGKGSAGLLNDFWEYDPVTDQWTQLANFPGGERENASVFVIDNKAYLGLGNTGPFWPDALADLWVFEPSTQSWAPRANYAGGQRRGSLAFSIGSKGYFGGGKNNMGLDTFDFWEYDPQLNSWNQKANLPNPTSGGQPPHYVLNGSMSYFDSFGGYHKSTNGSQWINETSPWAIKGTGWLPLIFDDRVLLLRDEQFQVTGEIGSLSYFPYNLTERTSGISFVINGKGYHGLGRSSTGELLSDIIEFDRSKL